MPRYVTRAAVWWDYDGDPSATADEIVDRIERFRPTGLYDQNGNPLYRCREPVGFRLRKENE